MDPVLNELSVAPAEWSIHERVRTLAATLKELDGIGLARVLRHTRNSLDQVVEGSTTMREALVRHPSRDERLFLLGRISRAPFVEDLHRTYEDSAQNLIEGTVAGVRCHGAVFAYLTRGPLVSLRGNEAFELGALPIRLARVREEPDAPLETEDVDVLQVAMPAHVAQNEKELRERVLRAVKSGREAWERRMELFPRLDFGAGVERQLAEMNGSELGFNLVIDALARLDAALRAWQGGPLDPGMKFSPESSSTLSHSVYGPQRDFHCVDGITRRFTLHLKLIAGNRRIYYLEHRVGAEGRAHVGYVGPHLPTTKYAT